MDRSKTFGDNMAFSPTIGPKRVLTGFAVAGMLLTTAACGSSGAANSPSGSAAPGASSTSGGTIRIGTDATYPPYEFKDGAEYAGLEIDFARAIGKALGKNIEFTDIKYSAAVSSLNGGRVDATMTGGTVDGPERQKQALLIDEFHASEGLITQAGNPKGLKDKASLCGYKVSVFAASPFETALKAASAKCGDKPIEVVSLSDANGPYVAVQSGRVDAYFGDYFQAAYQAKKINADAVKLSDAASYLAAFMVKIGNEEMAQQLATGLQKVIDSGEAKEIAAKYGIPESELVEKVTINDGKIPVNDVK